MLKSSSSAYHIPGSCPYYQPFSLDSDDREKDVDQYTGSCQYGHNCSNMHIDPPKYNLQLSRIMINETQLCLPLVEICISYLSLTTLMSMHMAHESKYRPIVSTNESKWKDVVCTSWYRNNFDHTVGGYYQTCGLQHSSPEDEKEIWKILNSAAFFEWKNVYLSEINFHPSLSIEAEVIKLVAKQVLVEGGSLYWTRIQENFKKYLLLEKQCEKLKKERTTAQSLLKDLSQKGFGICFQRRRTSKLK